MRLYKGNLFLFLFLIQYFAFAQSLKADNIDKDLLTEFKLLSPTQTIDTLVQLASIKFEHDQFKESLELFHTALALSEKHPQKHQYLRLLYQIGRSYYRMNNYNLAQEYLFKSLENINNETKPDILGNVYSVLSSTYFNLGDYNLAHEYKLKSIEIKELERDSFGISGDYYDLGSMFFYQSMYDKALDYYRKANDLGALSGNTRIVYNSTAAMGATYERLGDLEVSLKLNFRSLEIADSLDYITGKAYSLHNIGSNFIETKEFDKAIIYIQKSMEIKKEQEDVWGMIGSRLALGDLYTRTKQYRFAEKNLHNALKLAKEIESKGRISEVYMSLSKLYKKSGKKDLAINFLTKYIDLKDSIMNETILKEMGDRKSQFEIQKKEYEIELLRKDNALLESEKKVNQLNSFMAFGLSAFLLLICGAFYFLLVKQRKLSDSLKLKNKKIQKQKAKIESQNRLLESSNEDLKQFAYVASHDLREPLRMITSYSTLINRRYKELLDESGKEFLHFMTDAAQRMDKLLIDLLEYSRTSRNTDLFDKVSTKDIIVTIEALTKPMILENNAVLKFNESEFPMVLGRKTQLHQLFQNLISNALKYNINSQPRIEINCVKNCENYIFSVKDNGIGIVEDKQKKIFEMFHRLHSKEEFEGSGIGLATCKKIVEAHQGTIWVESIPGEGSTFFFSLPFINDEYDKNNPLPSKLTVMSN